MNGVTYKIIGEDGREYGPISLNEVRDWIDDQRVAPGTRVWNSEDGLWLKATDRQELHWIFDTQLLEQTEAPPPVLGDTTGSGLNRDLNEIRRRAPMLLRLAAMGCDYVLFTVALNLLTSPWTEQIRELNEAALKSIEAGVPDPKVMWDLGRFMLTAFMPASFVYYAAIPAVWGTTVGKFIARLAIEKTDGSRLTWGAATLRWLAAMGCLFTFGFGFLPIFFTPRRQGLHDLVAGTCVVLRRAE